VLLDGAVQAGGPRFLSSDYSTHSTKTQAGDNRNLDLRREFIARTDRAPIRVISILNGAFMDMLGRASAGCCTGATQTSRSTSLPRTTSPPMSLQRHLTMRRRASCALPGTC